MRPTIQPGTRLGHYEILGVLGRGGMGVVWRGRDTRLHREVAIKTLPDALAQDAERLSRLTREARLLAALNHPHIAAIYGLEEYDTLRFLVLELVEGGTLADRLRHAAMPVGEALAIGLQIADALEAAHEKGIVHRDLKPGNITLTPEGRVKVLDFGLAKTAEPTPAEASTETLPATELGQVMGTPAYMSPEQARGEAAGVQADIWSFGVVLYELLTGSSPFARTTTTETLAAVLAGTPEYARLPAQTPESVRRLIRRCLEPDRTRRFRHMGDVRIQLEDAPEPDAIAAGTDAGVVRHETVRGVAFWSAGAAALAVLSVAAVLVLSPGGEPARPLRAEITTPASLAPHHFALSPDGRYIAYVASASPDSVLQILYLRDLETNDVRAMPETAGAKYPCWSPDSRSIAYFDLEDLYRLDIHGGAPVPLAPAQNGLGCSWGVGGTILFAPSSVVPLYRVPEKGGESVEVTALHLSPGRGDPGRETNHRFPSFLPDGNRFLYFVAGGTDVSGIHLGSLDGGPSTRLTAADSSGVFVAPHWVVFLQGGTLVARRLDPDRAALTGDPLRLAVPQHAIGLGSRYLAFSASTTGRVAFRDAPEPSGVLKTYDTRGTELGRERLRNGPTVSPNQRYLAYDAFDGANRYIYLRDLERRDLEDWRVTDDQDAVVEGYPVFSPDSESVVYERQRESDELFELWSARIHVPSSHEPLYGEGEYNLIPLQYAANRYLLYRRSDRDFLSSNLYALRLPLSEEHPRPVAVAVSPYEERMGEISPDGDWAVFDRLVSRGRWQVVVRAFPEAGVEHPVATGLAPRWSDDGTSIYFISLEGALMEAEFSSTGSEPTVGTPIERFRTQIVAQAYNHQYAVMRAGSFLVNELRVDSSPLPINIIANWKP